MGTQAYLICEEKRTAYDLGKFLGTWAPVDWSETSATAFAGRISDAWLLGADAEVERAYATRLAAVLFRFCVDHAWDVRVVAEDYFIDEAQLDTDAGDLPLPVFRLLGSRWPTTPPFGLGYDLERTT